MHSLERYYILLIIFAQRTVKPSLGNFPECEFPDDWVGEWYLEGQRDPIQVNKEDFADKGMCYRQVANMNILYNRNTECFHCLIFFDRHKNILQFREGPCVTLSHGQEDVGSVEEVCSDVLKSDARIQTLIKVAGQDIACPFHGKFSMSFSDKGGPFCRNKKSRVEECMTNTQVQFTFDPCQTNQGFDGGRGLLLPQLLMENANSGVEILTCKGSWAADEGGGGGDAADEEESTYLVGLVDHALVSRIDQKIQCFLIRPLKTGQGYTIAQSSTCNGLNTIADGDRVINLTQVPEGESVFDETCAFPTWATVMGPMKSLTYTSHYEYSPDGTALTLSNYSYISGESHQIAVTSCVEVIEEDPEVSIKVLAKVTAGCDTKYKCMRLFKRTEHVQELQEGRLTAFKSQACSPENMDEHRLPYITLLKSTPPLTSCTAGGLYNVTDLNLKGTTDPCSPVGFSQISIHCQEPEKILFIQECGSIKDSEFFCMGGWEETVPYSTLLHGYQESHRAWRPYSIRRTYNPYSVSDDEQSFLDQDLPENITLGFLIARPKSEEDNAPRRVCITYMVTNETEYSWTVYTAACLRNILPGYDGLFKFNATKLMTCSANLKMSQLVLVFIGLTFSRLSIFQQYLLV